MEIGGYFELDYLNNKHYHKDAIKLNYARYALEYIVKVKKYENIYIPYYICDTAIEILNKFKVRFKFYSIDKEFLPKIDFDINDNEALLFVNYFGINGDKIEKLKLKYKNIIVDNTQSFFSLPNKDIDTFYSARKFLGVPDGAYLYINCDEKIELKQDISYDRYRYILKRIDMNAKSAYDAFLDNENKVNKRSLLSMSKLTDKVLGNINYEVIKKTRKENFNFIHESLSNINELNISEYYLDDIPMVYPLLIKNELLKSHLIKNNVFIPTYWREVLHRVDDYSFEAYLTKYLIPIPIDQRYSKIHMKYIIEKIYDILKY